LKLFHTKAVIIQYLVSCTWWCKSPDRCNCYPTCCARKCCQNPGARRNSLWSRFKQSCNTSACPGECQVGGISQKHWFVQM